MNAYEIMENYETAKKYIYPCFIGMNEKIDSDFYAVFDNTVKDDPKLYFRMIAKLDDELGSAVVSNKMLKDWGISRAELIRDCLHGREDKASIDILHRILGLSQDISDPLLYVVSNDFGYFGAGMIACPQVRDILYERLYTRTLIVLPCSIHEVIVMSGDVLGKDLSIETIDKTIKSINKDREIIKPEDILLDHAIVYKDI